MDPSVNTEKTDIMKEDTKNNVHNNWRRFIVGPIIVFYTFVFQAIFTITSQYAFYILQKQKFANKTMDNSQNNQSVCVQNKSLEIFHEMEEIQKEVATWNVYCNLGTGIPSFVAVILINSYSDRIGRKKAFLIPICGTIINASFCAAVAYFEISIYYIPITLFLEGLSGAWIGMIHTGYAYVADISEAGKSRTLAMATLDICIGVGMVMAQLVVGYLIHWTGFFIPMITIDACLVVSFILVLMLPETVQAAPKEKISPVQYVKNVFEFYVSPELAGKRWKYIICTTVFSCSILAYFGRISVETVYQLSSPFCWNSVQIGWFAALRSLLQFMIGMGLVKLLQKGFSDEMIGFVGALTSAGSSALEALAYNDWMMYLVPAVGITAVLPQPMMRGIMSKMTPMEKQGAMFGGLAAMDIAFSMIAAVTANSIYSSTLSIYRGIVFFVLSSYDAIGAFLILILYIGSYRTSKGTAAEKEYLISS
ncbi:lysosomal proton-coupled steroid conjugate and bile acid symporter SLC46A3-like [Mytilus trossulus]|uniref:lysosomal proton-coupled steroid conjugate and bile acid symporter SLC46A3-like n=1 Tax=Mytilus trossulus TaxID=6551 RepID=UPI00300609B5